MWINLEKLKDINDSEKVAKFNELLNHCLFLEGKYFTNLKLQSDFNQQVKKEVAKQNKKNVRFFGTPEIKKYYEDIIDGLKRKYELLKSTKSLKEPHLRAKIISEMAMEKKRENPLLLSSVRKSRAKLYPFILSNPAATVSEIQEKTGSKAGIVKKAMDELIVDGKLMIEKIDFIKEVVAGHAMLMKGSQLRLIERLQDKEAMENMSTNELVSILKNSSAGYSLLVGQTTDKNGGLLQTQDADLLNSVLGKHAIEIINEKKEISNN